MPVPEKATEIKLLLVAVFSFLTALWGIVGWMVILMIACVCVDYLTGTAAAKRNKTWSSDIARDGLWHKAGEFLVLFGALLLDFFLWFVSQTEAAAQFVPIGAWGFYVTLLVSVWYIITEIGSIIENAVAMGAKVPKWLTSGLAKLQEQADNMDPFEPAHKDVVSELDHPPDDGADADE